MDEVVEIPYLDYPAHILRLLWVVIVDITTERDNLFISISVEFIDVHCLCVYLELLSDLHILREVEILSCKLRHSSIRQRCNLGCPKEEEKHIEVYHMNDLDIFYGLELLLAVALSGLIDGVV